VNPDQELAAREADARTRLLQAGASALPPRPWQHLGQPPSAIDLILFAVWQARAKDSYLEVLHAALGLLSAARAEVDQIEAALLFAARSQGQSWAQIAQAMGLRSPQAAQQRFERVAGRAGPAASQ
jgi:hypothetical protein